MTDGRKLRFTDNATFFSIKKYDVEDKIILVIKKNSKYNSTKYIYDRKYRLLIKIENGRSEKMKVILAFSKGMMGNCVTSTKTYKI